MAELTAAAHQSWMDLQNDPIRLEKYMEMNRDWSMRNKFDPIRLEKYMEMNRDWNM